MSRAPMKEPRTTKEEMEGSASAGGRRGIRLGATRKVLRSKVECSSIYKG